VLNTTEPPAGEEPKWWEEQAHIVERALDDAARRLEQIAHLPAQVVPLSAKAS
jgi:hypothetical protein